MELRSKSTLLTNIPQTASGWDCKPEKVFQGRKPKIQKRRSREFSSPTFACDFLSELYRLYREGICCDVVLSSGDYETSAHKIVLVASSEYFKSLFTSSSDSAKDFIVLPSDISSEALKLVISYMYTGLLCLNSENVLSVFCAASKLQIKAAMFFCYQFYNRNGRNFDSSLPLLKPSLSNHHDQVNDITIKEELVAIDEAEFEGKISSDLFDAHSLTRDVNNPAVANTTDEVQAIQVVSRKRRTKAMLQERNDEDDFLCRSTSVKSEVACVPCPETVKGHGTVEDRRVTAETIFPTTRSKPKQNPRKRSKEPVVCMSRPRKRRRGPYKKKRTVSGVVKGVKPKKKVSSIGQILLREGTAFRCSNCAAGFEKHTGLALHQKFHHEVSVMSLTVKSYLQLLRSVIRQSRRYSLFGSRISTLQEPCGEKYACSTCKQKFSLRSEVLSHVMKHHGAVNHWQGSFRSNSMAKQSRFLRPCVYKCRYCKRPFVHRSTMSSHCLVNHKRIKRENCNGDEIPRLKQVRGNWLCKESGCNTDCSGLQGLKKHMASKHPDVIYSCPDCRFSCQVDRIFQRHRNQRHGKKQMCHLCGKICPKLCQLREHMFICHQIKDPALKLYQCAFEGCTYECSSEIRLADHSRRHNMDKSLKCEECGKAFKHPIGLQKHISTIHRGIRPFICDQCGMCFGFENDLKLHIPRHAKIKPYACSHCSFRTCDKSCLQHHLFSCHQIQAGLREPRLVVQKCDQCDFTTIRKGRFDDHMKKHRNIRDIPCPECGKLFVTKQNLYGHTVAVHRPKSLSCAYCNYTSAILSALKEHVRIMHTHRLEKLYECPICGFRSATSGNCRKHIQGKHREFGLNPRYVGAPRTSELMRAGVQDAAANSEGENMPNLICKDNDLCVTEK